MKYVSFARLLPSERVVGGVSNWQRASQANGFQSDRLQAFVISQHSSSSSESSCLADSSSGRDTKTERRRAECVHCLPLELFRPTSPSAAPLQLMAAGSLRAKRLLRPTGSISTNSDSRPPKARPRFSELHLASSGRSGASHFYGRSRRKCEHLATYDSPEPPTRLRAHAKRRLRVLRALFKLRERSG